MKRSKRYRAQSDAIDTATLHAPEDAFAFITEHAKAGFDESVEVHVKLGIDPKKGDQAIRSSVTLPHGTGKTARIGVITASKADDATKAGADVVGGQELVDEIVAGKLPEVDVLVATPDMMPKLAAAARILGPRGLMPSPKTDTVTTDVAGTIEQLKKGKESFKNDSGGNVHQVIGKVSFGSEKLGENFTTFMDALNSCKTTAHKGQFVLRVALCSTMGPSVKIKI